MSIFSNLKPEGGTKLHPFDLSRRDIFSVKSGVLNVNFIQHTIPESKYEVSHAQITRVDAIQTASFARMSENMEYYFVPYSQLFHDFERLYYERGDAHGNPNASAFGSNQSVSSMLPVFSYSSVISVLFKYFWTSRFLSKVLEQAPTFERAIMTDMRSVFNKYDSSSWILPLDVHGHICIDEMLKLFDNLGYGNLYAVCESIISPFFDFALPEYEYITNDSAMTAYNTGIMQAISRVFVNYYPAFNQDLYTNIFQIVKTNDGDYVPAWYSGASTKYLGFLTALNDINDFFLGETTEQFNLIDNFVSRHASYYPSILPIAAYVKIFSDIYRNSQYDTDDYSSLFNFDYVVQDSQARISWQQVILMLVPRFRQYKKDVFTGTYPNAQFGSVAVSSLKNPSDIFSSVTPSSSTASGVFVAGTNSTSPGRLYMNGVPSTQWNIDSGVSALAIRQALSLQRYKERILRAGNRLTALQNAVFGDKSRFIDDSYVQFIGANKSNIDFNSVAATSDAGASEVGQLGSNGVSTFVGKAFEFHSHDFGILMGIYYVLPEAEYESYMIDPLNTKSETNDFYKPDFMNLGLSPVYNYHFNFFNNGMPAFDVVLGYLANYWEYKTSIDKVHGAFYANFPMANLMAETATILAHQKGAFAHYVTPRNPLSLADGMNIGALYVNPHDIDSIFYTNSDYRMITDQFKVNCNHDVKALLPMSVNGLPEF